MIGKFQHHSRFQSRHLEHDHDLIVYFPPGYDASDERFPVLYLQDGQNLFDPATAFCGQDWGAGKTTDSLIFRGVIQPLILVGIYNAGLARVDEYTEYRDRRSGHGGKAPQYARMIVEELKPFMDVTQRTLPDRINTGIAGSSLGGLLSLAVGLWYPDIIGKIGVMSPSVWWGHRSILQTVRKAIIDEPPARLWLDTGTQEGGRPETTTRNARLLRDALIRKGWREGVDLSYTEAEGAGHNERAWGERFGPMLQFLFPKNR
jgi:predicted alpha/beta superfamily hydrolase